MRDFSFCLKFNIKNSSFPKKCTTTNPEVKEMWTYPEEDGKAKSDATDKCLKREDDDESLRRNFFINYR